LAGIPPLVGFYAKLMVLQAVIDAGMVWLAIVAVMFALIGAFCYLRVVKVVYFDEPSPDRVVNHLSVGSATVLSLNVGLIIVLGLLPGGLIALCLSVIRSSFL
jgi:NADH-quinone oxidoreductase subunit N